MGPDQAVPHPGRGAERGEGAGGWRVQVSHVSSTSVGQATYSAALCVRVRCCPIAICSACAVLKHVRPSDPERVALSSELQLSL